MVDKIESNPLFIAYTQTMNKEEKSRFIQSLNQGKPSLTCLNQAELMRLFNQPKGVLRQGLWGRRLSVCLVPVDVVRIVWKFVQVKLKQTFSSSKEKERLKRQIEVLTFERQMITKRCGGRIQCWWSRKGSEKILLGDFFLQLDKTPYIVGSSGADSRTEPVEERELFGQQRVKQTQTQKKKREESEKEAALDLNKLPSQEIIKLIQKDNSLIKKMDFKRGVKKDIIDFIFPTDIETNFYKQLSPEQKKDIIKYNNIDDFWCKIKIKYFLKEDKGFIKNLDFKDYTKEEISFFIDDDVYTLLSDSQKKDFLDLGFSNSPFGSEKTQQKSSGADLSTKTNEEQLIEAMEQGGADSARKVIALIEKDKSLVKKIDFSKYSDLEVIRKIFPLRKQEGDLDKSFYNLLEIQQKKDILKNKDEDLNYFIRFFIIEDRSFTKELNFEEYDEKNISNLFFIPSSLNPLEIQKTKEFYKSLSLEQKKTLLRKKIIPQNYLMDFIRDDKEFIKELSFESYNRDDLPLFFFPPIQKDENKTFYKDLTKDQRQHILKNKKLPEFRILELIKNDNDLIGEVDFSIYNQNEIRCFFPRSSRSVISDDDKPLYDALAETQKQHVNTIGGFHDATTASLQSSTTKEQPKTPPTDNQMHGTSQQTTDEEELIKAVNEKKQLDIINLIKKNQNLIKKLDFKNFDEPFVGGIFDHASSVVKFIFDIDPSPQPSPQKQSWYDFLETQQKKDILKNEKIKRHFIEKKIRKDENLIKELDFKEYNETQVKFIFFEEDRTANKKIYKLITQDQRKDILSKKIIDQYEIFDFVKDDQDLIRELNSDENQLLLSSIFNDFSLKTKDEKISFYKALSKQQREYLFKKSIISLKLVRDLIKENSGLVEEVSFESYDSNEISELFLVSPENIQESIRIYKALTKEQRKSLFKDGKIELNILQQLIKEDEELVKEVDFEDYENYDVSYELFSDIGFKKDDGKKIYKSLTKEQLEYLLISGKIDMCILRGLIKDDKELVEQFDFEHLKQDQVRELFTTILPQCRLDSKKIYNFLTKNQKDHLIKSGKLNVGQVTALET